VERNVTMMNGRQDAHPNLHPSCRHRFSYSYSTFRPACVFSLSLKPYALIEAYYPPYPTQ
jgi:hypothetical protein